MGIECGCIVRVKGDRLKPWLVIEALDDGLFRLREITDRKNKKTRFAEEGELECEPPSGPLYFTG